MLRITLITLISTLIACSSKNSKQNEADNIVDSIGQSNEFLKSVTDCPENWIATGKQLEQIRINDTTEQVLLNDSLWFELIGFHKIDGQHMSSYLRFYRTNGLLEQEGIGTYADHPIADYLKYGEWKYYDCNGELTETKNYENGKLSENN